MKIIKIRILPWLFDAVQKKHNCTNLKKWWSWGGFYLDDFTLEFLGCQPKRQQQLEPQDLFSPETNRTKKKVQFKKAWLLNVPVQHHSR